MILLMKFSVNQIDILLPQAYNIQDLIANISESFICEFNKLHWNTQETASCFQRMPYTSYN